MEAENRYAVMTWKTDMNHNVEIASLRCDIENLKVAVSEIKEEISHFRTLNGPMAPCSAAYFRFFILSD